jgi:hypothetical protein
VRDIHYLDHNPALLENHEPRGAKKNYFPLGRANYYIVGKYRSRYFSQPKQSGFGSAAKIGGRIQFPRLARKYWGNFASEN